MAVYSVVLTNLHHVYKYQAEGFAVGGGVIAFIQIHMANKTNEVRKFCLDFDLRRFDTILIDPAGNISKSRPHIYIYVICRLGGPYGEKQQQCFLQKQSMI